MPKADKPKSLKPNREYVTIGEAANFLGVSIDTIRRWERAGKLTAHRLDGKNRHFYLSDLASFKAIKQLSVAEVAALLNVSLSTVRRLESRGLLVPERTVHGKRLYNPLSIGDYLTNKERYEGIIQPTPVLDKFQSTKHAAPVTRVLPTAVQTPVVVDKQSTVESALTLAAPLPAAKLAPEPVMRPSGQLKQRQSQDVRHRGVVALGGMLALILLMIIVSPWRTSIANTSQHAGAGDSRSATPTPLTAEEAGQASRLEVPSTFYFTKSGLTVSIINPASISMTAGNNFATRPVTSGQIADGAVGGAQLAQGGVTFANLAPDVQKRINQASNGGKIVNITTTPIYNSYPTYTTVQQYTDPHVAAGNGLMGTVSGNTMTLSLNTGTTTALVNNNLEVRLSGGEVTNTISSLTGLEQTASGLQLLGGCTAGQVLQYTGTAWDCTTAGSGSSSHLAIQSGGTTVTADATAVNFTTNDFTVTNNSGQATVAIDYAGSGITRAGRAATIVGNWSFTDGGLRLTNTSDATKQVAFDSSAISSGTTRTLTVPDASGVILTTGNLASITSVGTITTGTWQGSTLGVPYGGTGATSFTAQGIIYGNGNGALQASAAGTAGQVLQANGSGVPTFTSVSGDITLSALGVATIGAGKVNNNDLLNSALSVTAGTGLTGGGSVALGSSTTLSVVYGSLAGTAAQGDASLSFTGTGNLTGSVTGTAGGGFTTNSLAVVNNPTFTTSVTTPVLTNTGDLTVAATGTSKKLILSASGTIQLSGFNCSTFANGGTLTTDASGNLICQNDDAGPAGAITGSGTTGTVPVYTGSGSLGDSPLLVNGSTVQLAATNDLSLLGGNLSITGNAGLSGNINIGGNLQTGSTTRLDASGVLHNVTGDNLNGVSFNANTITGGTLSNAVLASSVTVQGNTFNGSNQLVKLTADGKLPAIDGSQLTGITATYSGTLGVSNGGTGLTSLTSNGIIYGNGTSAVGVTAAGTVGQILQAGTGGTPSFTTISGDASLANGGALTIANGVVTNAKLANNTLTVTAGTGLSGGGLVALGSSTTLSVVYGSSANTAAAGNTNLSFTGTGNLTGSVTGTAGGGFTTNSLAVVNNPTFTTSVTTPLLMNEGDLTITTIGAGSRLSLSSGSGTVTIGSNLDVSLGGIWTNSTLRLSNAGVLQNVSADATNGVAFNANTITTGTISDSHLSSAVTMQGNTFNGSNQLVQLTAAGKLPAIDGSQLTGIAATTYSGTLPVSNGGIGVTSLTTNGLVYGNGSSAVGVTAAGTPGQLLQAGNGGVPVFSTLSGDASLAAGGALTIANGVVTNAKLANSNLTVAAGTGLSGGGLVALGSTTTLSVVYGSLAGTAAQGDASLSFTGTGNLTGSVTGTAGGGFTTNSLAVVNNPTFTTSVTTPVLNSSGALAISSAGMGNDLSLSSGSGTINLGAGTLAAINSVGINLDNVGTTALTLTNSGGGIANFNLANGKLQTAGVTRLDNSGALQDVTGDNSNGVSFNANTLTSGTIDNARLSTNVTVQGNSFNGSNQLVQLTAAGKLPALDGSALTGIVATSYSGTLGVGNGGTGLSSLTTNGVLYASNSSTIVQATGTDAQILLSNAGVPTFTTLSGDLTVSASGVTTIGAATVTGAKIAAGTVTNANLVNSGITVTAGTGLGGGGALSLGASTSLSVTYGSTGGTAVQGSTTLVCPSGTGNLSGGGNTITLGSGGSCNSLNITNTPTFSGAITANGGLIIAGGQQLTNSGSTLNTSLTVGDVAGGGPIGSAASTVDIATSFIVNQTTSGQALTLPIPSTATAGRIAYVTNTGSASFTMYGALIPISQGRSFIWNGAAWSMIDAEATSVTAGTGISITGTTISVAGSVPTSVINDTNVQGSISGNVLTLSFNGTLGVGRGGTGLSSLTTNSLLYATGTSSFGQISGTSAQVLLANGSGVPTFTSLTGDVTIGSTGITAIGAGKVTNTNLANSSLTVTAGTNLSGGGAVALGSSVTLNLASSPVLSGTLGVQGSSVTIGTTTTPGTLVLNNGSGASNKTATLQGLNTLGQNTVYTLPDPGQATANICLSTGNCGSFGAAGGDLTGSYPSPTIASGVVTGTKIAANTISNSNILSGSFGNITGVGTLGSLAVTGTVTLSALNVAGVVHNDASGNLTTSKVALGTDTSGAYVSSVGATNTSISIAGTAGTPTLSVNYGSGANQAAAGANTFTCASGTGNLSGGGTTVTLGVSGTTCGALTLVNSPVLSGTLAVQGSSVTVGQAGTAGSLVLNSGAAGASNKTGTVQAFATLAQNTVYTLPDPGQATANICLSTGNCGSFGAAGGDLTGSYPSPTIAAGAVTGTKIANTTITNANILSGSFGNITGVGTLGSLTVSGAVTLSGLSSAGIVHNSAAGLLSTSLVALGTDTSGAYVSSVGATNTSISIAGTAGAPTLSINYGSGANQAAAGSNTINCPTVSGSNLGGGGGSFAVGAGGSCSGITFSSTPTFTSVTSPSFTGSGAVGLSSGGSGDLTLTSASNALVLGATSIKTTGSLTQDLSTASTANTFTITNSGAGGTADLNIAKGGLQIAGTTVLSSTKALSGLTGISSSGTITLSGLNSVGVVHTDASGNLTTSKVALGTDTSGAYVTSVGATNTSLTVGGTASAPTLSVNYGTGANQAAAGSNTISCPTVSGTNLTGGGGSFTVGAGGSCSSIGFSATPTFTSATAATFTSSAALTVSSTGANDLTLTSGSGNIALQATSLTTNNTSEAFDLKGAGANVFTIKNTGTGTADFNINNGGFQIGGTTIITSAKVLSGVTADTGILTSGTLGVGRGGIGINSLTTNSLLYASGATSVGQLSGTDGKVLLSNAGVPTFTTLTGDVTVTGTGTTAIGTGKVTGTQIANTTITNANLASGSFGAITGVGTLGSLAVTGTVTGGTYNGATISSTGISGPAAFGVSSTGANDLSLTSGSGNLVLAATTVKTTAGLTFDLNNAGATTYSITNSGTGVASLNVEGTVTAGTGLTVTTGGATISGNSTIAGTLGSLTGLSLASGSINVNSGGITNAGSIGGVAGLTFVSGALNLASGGITNTGALAGVTTITTTGAINGITIGSTITPAAAGVLTVKSNGANALGIDVGGAAAINIGNGTTGTAINIGNTTSNPVITFSGSGAFGTTTGTNTLNGATIVSGTNTFTVNGGLATFQAGVTINSGSNFLQSGAGTFDTGTGAVGLNGNVTIASGKTFTLLGTGATTLGGTLNVTGASTLAGLSVTSLKIGSSATAGDILTTDASGNISFIHQNIGKIYNGTTLSTGNNIIWTGSVSCTAGPCNAILSTTGATGGPAIFANILSVQCTAQGATSATTNFYCGYASYTAATKTLVMRLDYAGAAAAAPSDQTGNVYITVIGN